MSQIIIGYTAEGSTDNRFLSSVIHRTFIDVGFECQRDIEVIEPIVFVPKPNGEDFVNQIEQCALNANSLGVMAFCIHVDADDADDKTVFDTRINPVLERIQESQGSICSNIIPVIPVQMTEAWMLADKELLKEEIGTNKNDNELGINRPPESIANPKNVISEAIRIAREGYAKHRRKDLTISDLYQPLGQKISITALDRLSSFANFKEAVRDAYRTLNYLR